MSHTQHWCKHAGLKLDIESGVTIMSLPHGPDRKPFVWRFKDPMLAERFAKNKALGLVKVKHGKTLLSDTPQSYDAMVQAILPK